MKIKNTTYLDHAAATPLDSRVFKAMKPFLQTVYGNPSSLHHKGVEAKNAIENARKTIAGLITARPEEIVFTFGGTESCNLAIFGSLGAIKGERGHIITTAIEHHAVLEPLLELKKQGWKITYLKPNREGLVDAGLIQKAIQPNTALVTVMYANNEIGSIEPVAQIGRAIAQVNQVRARKKLKPIVFHTDACQAVGTLDLNVNRLQVDLMSVSASKIYGPKGIGFLYIRKGISVAPIILGGGQEHGKRSGTENVAGIVGMAKALELAESVREKENQRLIGLRDFAIKAIKRNFPRAVLNGPESKPPHGKFEPRYLNRLPNNINFTFPGIEGEALMLYLDAEGIYVSTGSACATGSTDASHVLTAIGRNAQDAKSSIRITLGRATGRVDLTRLLQALKKNIKLLSN